MNQFVADSNRWNHSIRYWNELLPLVSKGARTALDVGCGEGFASRSLAARGLTVTGIDPHAPSIADARAQAGGDITYVEDDVMTARLDPAGYDVVAAIAVLHHVPLEAGLERMRELVAPGGQLLVVGCAASEMPRDAAREAAAAVAHQVDRLRRPQWEHSSPAVWPPPVTYRQVEAAAAAILPGADFRRRLLWRYTLTWVKPA